MHGSSAKIKSQDVQEGKNYAAGRKGSRSTSVGRMDESSHRITCGKKNGPAWPTQRAGESSEMRKKRSAPKQGTGSKCPFNAGNNCIFQMCIYGGKRKRAYRKLPALMSLQKRNGANVGNMHK